MLFGLFSKKESVPQKEATASGHANETYPDDLIIYLVDNELPKSIRSEYGLDTIEDAIWALPDFDQHGEWIGHGSDTGVTDIQYAAADADQLFSLIRPVLEGNPLCNNAEVLVRKAGSDSAERRIRIALNAEAQEKIRAAA